MFKYLNQNKHIIMVSVALFIISMSTLMFFVGSNSNELHESEYKADIIHAIKVKSPQEEERKYRELVHNEEDSLVVLNLDGTIEFVSWDFELLLGYQQQEMFAQPLYSLIYPDDLAIFLKGFGKGVKTQETVTVIGPYRLRNKNGDYHYYMSTGVPILENHKMTGMVMITRSMSESAEKPKIFHGQKIRNQTDKNAARLMAEKVQDEL